MIACKDCKHCAGRGGLASAPLCLHPATAAELTDYYTGEKRREQPSIVFARSVPCGPEAKLFEPKE